MKKNIRPAYPAEISIGLLILIFVVSFVLSSQIIDSPHKGLHRDAHVYFGMFLASAAIIIMFLVLWEEFLFPVHIKKEQDGAMVFRNHRSKLKTQILIYLLIPVILAYIYFNFQIYSIPFLLWATICIIFPVAGKLISGINNYNDFLRLSDDRIEYKNNKKEGVFDLKDLQHINLVRDERKLLHKIELAINNEEVVTIDLDEMELEDFLVSIETHMASHYQNLIRKEGPKE